MLLDQKLKKYIIKEAKYINNISKTQLKNWSNKLMILIKN